MNSTTRRVFIARYRGGLMFTPGPVLYIAPMLLLPALLLTRNVWAALGVAFVGMVFAMVAWTSVRQRRPALILAPEGMALEGMPLQPWSQIEGIRPVMDDRDRPAIEVRLRRGAPPVPRSPLWRASGRHTIVIYASLLSDPPPDIEEAFEYFLTNRVR
jgi:hypothetical protein